MIDNNLLLANSRIIFNKGKILIVWKYISFVPEPCDTIAHGEGKGKHGGIEKCRK